MISDVLSEAIREINRYMDEMPEAYGPLEARIRKLLADMEDLRAILDTPPVEAGSNI